MLTLKVTWLQSYGKTEPLDRRSEMSFMTSHNSEESVATREDSMMGATSGTVTPPTDTRPSPAATPKLTPRWLRRRTKDAEETSGGGAEAADPGACLSRRLATSNPKTWRARASLTLNGLVWSQKNASITFDMRNFAVQGPSQVLCPCSCAGDLVHKTEAICSCPLCFIQVTPPAFTRVHGRPLI